MPNARSKQVDKQFIQRETRPYMYEGGNSFNDSSGMFPTKASWYFSDTLQSSGKTAGRSVSANTTPLLN